MFNRKNQPASLNQPLSLDFMPMTLEVQARSSERAFSQQSEKCGRCHGIEIVMFALSWQV